MTLSRNYQQPFNEQYLKDKYGMYVVSSRYHANRRGKGGSSGDVDFSKVLVEVKSKSWSAKNDHDFSSSSEQWYFASDNMEFVEKIKSLDPSHNEVRTRSNGSTYTLTATIPKGDAVREYFKPIFRDLAINANFEDPFQTEYNARFFKKVNDFLHSLDFIVHNYEGSQSAKFKAEGKEPVSPYSEYLFPKTKDGIDFTLQVHFDPTYKRGGYVVLSPSVSSSIGLEWTDAKLLTNDDLKAEMLAFIEAVRKMREVKKSFTSDLISEFPFLSASSSQDYTSVWLDNAFRFEIPTDASKEVKVYEETHQLNNETYSKWLRAGVFNEKDYQGINEHGTFENLEAVKVWLRDEANLKPFYDFQVRLAQSIAHNNQVIERKKAFVPKFKLKDIKGFELKLGKTMDKWIEDEVDTVEVYANGVLLTQENWSEYWNDTDDKTFRQTLASILFEAIKGIIMDLKHDYSYEETKAKFSPEVLGSVCWFWENYKWASKVIGAYEIYGPMIYSYEEETWNSRIAEMKAIAGRA